MKHILKTTLVLFTALFIGCGSDDDNAGEPPISGEPPILSAEKSIETFVFTTDLNEGLNTTVEASIDQNSKEITVTFPANTAVTNLKPTLTISENATVSPSSEEEVNFTNTVTYTLTAEDKSTQEYTVKSEVATQTNITATPINISTDKELNELFFVSESTGFIVGGDTKLNSDNDTAIIFKTTDGGTTWNSVFSDNGYYAISVYATSENSIYVTTNKNFILKTTDGGTSWEEIKVSNNSFFMSSIKFIDSNTGYIAGSSGPNGRLYKTTNAGETWTNTILTDLRNNQLNNIDFSTTSTILISGGAWSNGTIFRSTDSGANWETINVSNAIKTTDVTTVDNTSFLVGNNGVNSIGSELGELFKSTNNGENWNKVDTGFTNKMKKICYLNEVICIVGKNNSDNDLTNPEFIIVSQDNGDSWTRVEHPDVIAGWNDVQFISDNKIIAVGYGGRAILIQL